jgi:sugar phosphate isomerase/epimerase
MKLSVSTYSLLRWRNELGKSLEDSVDWIGEAGVEGIEFSGLDEKGKADPVRRAGQVRKRAEKRGLKVVSYCIGAELLVSPEKQREAVAFLKQQVDVAAELGAPSMRHDVTRGFGEWNTDLKIPRDSYEAVLKVLVPAAQSPQREGSGLPTSAA